MKALKATYTVGEMMLLGQHISFAYSQILAPDYPARIALRVLKSIALRLTSKVIADADSYQISFSIEEEMALLWIYKSDLIRTTNPWASAFFIQFFATIEKNLQ